MNNEQQVEDKQDEIDTKNEELFKLFGDKEALHEIDVKYSLAYTTDDFNGFIDSIENQITNHEIIYYAYAMEILTKEDDSLKECMEIASDMGYEVANLNSELLATLLIQNRMHEELAGITDEIEIIFSDIEDLKLEIEELKEEEA